VLQRAFKTARLDRRSSTEVVFDTGAMGDAVLVVALVHGAVFLVAGLLSGGLISRPDDLVLGLIQTLIYGIAQWILLAAATWLAGTRLFKGDAQMPTVIRVQGYAYLPLLITLLIVLAPEGAASSVVGIVAVVWFLASLIVASSVALGLGTREAAYSVLIGYGILLIFGLLLRVPFLAVSAIF